MRAMQTQSDGPNRTGSSHGILMTYAVTIAMIIAGLVIVSYPVTAAVIGGFVLALRYIMPRLVRTVRTIDLSTMTSQVEISTSQAQQ